MKLPNFSIVLLALLAFSTSATTNLVRVPIKKHIKEEPRSWGNTVNFDAKKGLPIANVQNTQYYATFKIGSEGQEFNLILDTGSATLWVPEYSAFSGKLSTTFNCEYSSTCHADKSEVIQLKYGTGAIQGYLVTDQVNLGGLVMQNFDMILATSIGNLTLRYFDGLIGLSFSSYLGFPTVLDTLKDQKLIDVRTFSMYLGDDSSSNGGNTGEIIFGGYDPQYAASDFQFVKVKNTSDVVYWQSNLVGMGLGNINISDMTNYPAIFDSGTSLLLLPQDYIDNIVQEAQNQGTTCYSSQMQGLYACNCGIKNVLGDLIFYFEGASFNIPPSSYIISSYGTCYLAMQPIEGSLGPDQPIILGDVFLKNYYALYTVDNSTVGLAKAVPIKHFPGWIIFVGILGLILVAVVICCFLRKRKANQAQSNYQAYNQGRGVTIGGGSNTRGAYRPNPYQQERERDNEGTG